jgi:hypothetical protein
MCRGLGGHGVAKSTLALAAPHDFGGHKLHFGHARLTAVRRTTEFYLFKLGVVLAFLHLIVSLLNTTEL